MAENGILDYQGMNQAIYRGATSNIIVDTQSMSIEIGAGNSSHTSNLHIECDHDANVASIQLNSNVVTEFSRSKKLIKYPRVALTQNDESGTSGYVASAHSEYPDGTNYHAFRVFNNWGPAKAYIAGAGWESANELTFGDNGMWGGPNASGATTSGSADTTMTLEEGNTIYGEWLQIQLPTKIRLEYVNFSPLSLYGGTHDFLGAYRSPRAGYILGSNNGTNWTTLKNWSGIDYDTWVAHEHTFYKFDIDKEVDNYQYFRFVWTETASGSGSSYSRYASCQELEFWGIPEYDPEAHGTDVTVKSVANVPNTDWLEVYYDGQDYSDMPSTVDNKTGVSTYDATPTGGVGFDSTYKAFTFDSSSNQYLSTSTPMSGNYVHSFSMWFKPTNLTATSGDELLYVGANGTSTKVEVFIESDRINYTFGANDYQAYRPFLNNVWHHLVLTYNGVGGQSGREIYLDGVRQEATHTGSTGVLAISTNNLDIGRYTPSGSSTAYAFDGSIANFRLFNRVLTSDEIYQLYAYQKEDFGHGTNNMTLKAGRLGIGTSEPRGALDVRGDAYYGCPVLFDCVASSTTNVGSYMNWNLVKLNKGGGLSGTTFTAPVEGHYFFHVHVMGVWTSSSGDVRFLMEWHKNGAHYGITSELDAQMYDGRDDVDSDNAHLKLSGSIIAHLEIGDTIKIIVPSNASMGVHGRYNRFTGHYIG